MSNPGTSIIASSSSETSDNGDESLANKSGDTDRDTDRHREAYRRQRRNEGERGDEGASISTSKLLERSLPSEGYAEIPFRPPPKLFSDR